MSRKFISMCLSFLMMLLVINVNVFAEESGSSASEIRFDFSESADDVTVAGTSGATASVANDHLVISVTESADLACKTVGAALPTVDLGTGGYYMYVKAKYELSSGVTMGSHYVKTSEESYGITSEPWSGYKLNCYDITSLTDKQTLTWEMLLSDSSSGTLTVNISYIVLSTNAGWTEQTTTDIRFDFLNGIGDATIRGLDYKSSWANGIVTVSKPSTSNAATQIQIETATAADLGDGGYYLYVKAKYKGSATVTNGPLSGVFVGYSDTANVEYPTTVGAQSWITWTEDEWAIKRYDLTTVTGSKYLRLYFQTRKYDGTTTADVDWIVLSKNSSLDETTAMIESMNGTELAQDGSITDVAVDKSVFDALTSGTGAGLPTGLTATSATDVSDVSYTTTVTEVNGYKIVDVMATGTKNSALTTRCYRLRVVCSAQANGAALIVEAEDLTDTGVNTQSETTVRSGSCSGSGFVAAQSKSAVTFVAPVYIEEAGTYNIEVPMCLQDGSAVLSVDTDDVQLTQGTEETMQAKGSSWGSWRSVVEHYATVQLQPGIHTMTLTLTPAASKNMTYVVDCINIARKVGVSVENEKVSDGVFRAEIIKHSSLDEPTRAYLAIYESADDMQLKEVKTIEMTQEAGKDPVTSENMTTTLASGNIVKLFVWTIDDLTPWCDFVSVTVE